MGYKMRQHGIIRDECYPAKIAEARPMLATRLTWEDNTDADGDKAVHSGPRDRVRLFNEQLRGGHRLIEHD